MPKKEKLFPIDTIGGRIQFLRRDKAKLTRAALYDKVFPDSPVWAAPNKDKTVYNWESGKSELDYETMIAVCKALDCSSDYLLGLDECTNKTNQFIHDQIGISEDSIEIMHLFANEDDWTLSMDFLLHSKDFTIMLPCFYDYAFSSFTYIYTDLLYKNERTALYNDLLHDYLQSADLNELEINKSLVHIIDSLTEEATKKAKHAFNAPSGSSTFEGTVENFKRKSGKTYLDDDA